MAQVVQYNYVVHRILSSGKAVFDVAFETIDWIFHYNFDGIYVLFFWLVLKCTISGKEIHWNTKLFSYTLKTLQFIQYLEKNSLIAVFLYRSHTLRYKNVPKWAIFYNIQHLIASIWEGYHQCNQFLILHCNYIIYRILCTTIEMSD